MAGPRKIDPALLPPDRTLPPGVPTRPAEALTEIDASLPQGKADDPSFNRPEAKKGQKTRTHVVMVRNPNIHPAPHSAHVHLDEVENFKPGGWVIDDGADGPAEG